MTALASESQEHMGVGAAGAVAGGFDEPQGLINAGPQPGRASPDKPYFKPGPRLEPSAGCLLTRPPKRESIFRNYKHCAP